MSLNEHLAALLDIAEQMKAERIGNEAMNPSGALRYAILKRLESELGLPVVVKYGDADAVKASMGIEGNRVWESIPDDDSYSLIRIEVEENLGMGDRGLLDRTMLAAGAWYVGDAGLAGNEAWMHMMYVLPNDNPAADMIRDE